MNPYEANTAFVASIAFMAAAVLILGVGAFITLATLWRLREPLPDGLGALLAREGLDWSRIAAVGAIGEVGVALDRCGECGAKARCADWLASGSPTGYEAFCPNAALVERLKGAA